MIVERRLGPAEKLAEDLNREFPHDTLMQHYSLPVIRAIALLGRGEGEQALDLIEATSGYELGCPQAFANTEPPLYPIYVRGEAYLKSGKGREAAAEFEKMIHNWPWNYPLFALPRLQLGRAEALIGEKEKARKGYQDFLALWKDADPGVPILKAAKAEYEQL